MFDEPQMAVKFELLSQPTNDRRTYDSRFKLEFSSLLMRGGKIFGTQQFWRPAVVDKKSQRLWEEIIGDFE